MRVYLIAKVMFAERDWPINEERLMQMADFMVCSQVPLSPFFFGIADGQPSLAVVILGVSYDMLHVSGVF
ncbi:hypothetical protein B0W47_00765 [Komagataeibacter nataicola]|uniref:Uncharacterized protein n=1 Tax=Komagataeibacter nataicola TaxID=265960 RepID=A0A9N7CAF1_9PROT|nr:hypothetical protein B0W47_00765 [Komagataeibacter nataicola]PYD64931.1 hypothetical protein CDI09_16480 [Komagataeibacter nataicola]